MKQVERDGRVIEYVEATLEDIAAANRLADPVLSRSLDELPPQSRTLLARLEAMVAGICETRRPEPVNKSETLAARV